MAPSPDQRMGSPEGRLHMRGVLSGAQSQALSHYRRDLTRYQRSISTPADPSGELFREHGRSLEDMNESADTNVRDADGKAVLDMDGRPLKRNFPSSRAALAAWHLEEAREALEARGPAAVSAVDIVVRHNVEPTAPYHEALQNGATGLAEHYRIPDVAVSKARAKR
jgi:hypothetical protein